MFDTQHFLNELDAMYGSGRTREAKAYLDQGLAAARKAKDQRACLAVLNEIMGYCRTIGLHDESLSYSKEAVTLAEEMGLAGTLQYATLLLNAATACRAAGKYGEAEAMYARVYEIYRGQLWEPDYRMASLYNNRSILYSETGRLLEARSELEQAMEIIRRIGGSEVEIAVTHTNLGSLCLKMGRIQDGTAHLRQAVEIYESLPGPRNSHYSSALSGLGEAFYRKGELEQSAKSYEKALSEIEEHYGRNEAYRITERNRDLVKDLLRRKQVMKEQNLRGLQLAREYYETCGKPMITQKYPEYADRIAAGLLGEGSECLGFDDEHSLDHDFGPGFCLWLTQEDYRAIGAGLQADYEALPREFRGFPARNSTAQAGKRVGVFEIGAFFKRLTGREDAPETDSSWWKIPQEALRTATSGEIFEDPLGEFTERRERFQAYPETVRLKKLALALGKMGQAGQYNYSRAKKRGDMGAAYFCLSEFLSGAAEAAYLMNGIYMPFYKWRMRGMESFTLLQDSKAMLEELMGMNPGDDGVEEKIEALCGRFVRELNRLGLSQSGEIFLESQKEELWKRAEQNQ